MEKRLDLKSGEKDAKIEIAKKMIKARKSKNEIIEFTGLSEKEINDLL